MWMSGRRRTPGSGPRSRFGVGLPMRAEVEIGFVYDDALIRPWFESAVGRVPGLSLFDAHAHIGFNDPDGLGLSPG
jgi:hypothetical protein